MSGLQSIPYTLITRTNPGEQFWFAGVHTCHQKTALIGGTLKFAVFHQKLVRSSSAKSYCGFWACAELILIKTSKGSLPVRGGSHEANLRCASDEGRPTWICRAAGHSLEPPDNVTSGSWGTGLGTGAVREHWGLIQESPRLRIIGIDRVKGKLGLFSGQPTAKIFLTAYYSELHV